MNLTKALSVISGEDRRPIAAAQRLALGCLTPAYRTAMAVRNRLFDRHLPKSTKLPRPTISVGNLTTGGTGKTPMVIQLAKRLTAMGRQPAILLRGYRPGLDGSDEATELRNALGQTIPVEPDPDRVAAADRVLDRHPQTDVFLLDDAFQHRQVQRDLDLVLIDATCPFGFGRLLPRGLLREPMASLRRADGVIVTRADQVDSKTLADLDATITTLTGAGPMAHAAHQWSGLRVIDSGGESEQSLEQLPSKTVVGICGIGNPQAFLHTLNAASGKVLRLEKFDDHHHYTKNQITSLLENAASDGAQAVVITEKDWVKWRQLPGVSAHQASNLPIIRPILSIGFLDGSQVLDEKLRSVLNS